MRKVVYILFSINFLFSVGNHPELIWKTMESDHFLVHFHNGTEWTAREALNIAEFVYTPITDMYDYRPKEKTHIVIKDTDDFSNGSAFFFDNKIEIWANPLDFDLRGSHRWIENVITHEFVHIIQLGASLKHNRHFPAMYLQSMGYEDEKRSDVLYGYPNTITSYAIPSVTVPPWFAEGVAQCMLEGANYDFWDTHRDMILRDVFLNDNVYTINQLNSFGKTGIGNEQIYNQGFSLSAYLIDRFGSSVFKDISKEISKPYIYSFSSAIKNITGVELDVIYDDWYLLMKNQYVDNKTSPFIVKGDIIIEEGTTNLHPTWSEDGTRFAYLSNANRDYFGQTDLYVYSFSDSSSKKIISGVFSAPTWLNDSTIVYTKKSKPNKHGSRFYDLYSININNKKDKPKRLTVDKRLTSPSIDYANNKISAIGIADGTSNIYIANLDSIDNLVFDKITNYSDGEKIFSLSHQGDKILFDALIKDHGRDIYQFDLINYEIKPTVKPLEDNIWDERDPMGSNQFLVYSSDRTGKYNIYKQGIDQSLIQLTNVDGGAFMPSISDNKVLCSLYENGQYKISIIDLDKESNLDLMYEANYTDYAKESMIYDFTSDIKIKDYSQDLSMPFIFPRLLFDYGTVKPGLYFYASDPLDKYFLFGGASTNSIDDLDLFLLFELKRYSPTLYANFYWVTRNLKRTDSPTSVEGIDYDNVKFKSNDTYIMFSADLGIKKSYKGHNISLNYNYSKYTAHSLGYTKLMHNGELESFYPFDITYDYFRGHKVTLGYNLKNYSPRYVFNMIPQNGYEINSDISIEKNQFDPSFEVSEEYGTLTLVFSSHDTYRFNLDIKKNTSLVKNKRIALNQRLKVGYLDNKKIDDFFYFFGGGLTGIRGYTFYEETLSGTEMALFSNTIRLPLFLEKNYKLLHLLIQNLSFSYILEGGIARGCESQLCGDPKYSNGLEIRVNGTSFYAFPFALSYEIHRSWGNNYSENQNHYIKLLFEFME